MMFLLDVA